MSNSKREFCLFAIAVGCRARIQGEREPRPADPFCLVKTYIHDTHLQQPPLMVLPAEFRIRVSTNYPGTLRHAQTGCSP